MNVKSILFGLIVTSLLIVNVSLIGSGFTINSNNNYKFSATEPIIANHLCSNKVRLNQIPEAAIITAKNTLHVAYGHTSHGSQIIDGMSALPDFKESKGGTLGLYDWNDGPLTGALDINDYFVSGDLGNPDFSTWESLTREYLDDSTNSDVNVVMWSWCGQVSGASEEDINLYLYLMTKLEEDYPDVNFVYMTGHTDGGGLEGNLHIRNNQIRDYCIYYDKILFDFADIESYDPDDNYFGNKYVTDNCDFDSNGDGDPWNDDANWAIEWQDANPDEWYDCESAHSQPLNANLKAYTAWWLWAVLAGWDDSTYTPPTPTTTPTFDPSNFTPPTNNISLIGGILSTSLIVISMLSAITLIKKVKKQ